MSKIRLERVNSEMMKNISEILHNGLRDAELTAMTGVTYVKVTPDLKHAKVGISIYGDDEVKRKNFEAVAASKGFIKKELALRMGHMHALPELHFEMDTGLDYSEHINKILKELNKDD